MKDSSSLHLKVQELCDCFATSDPLKDSALTKYLEFIDPIKKQLDEIEAKQNAIQVEKDSLQ